MTEAYELTSRISFLEDALQVFALPQWQNVLSECHKRLDKHTQQVMNARPNTMSLEEVEQRRGQVRELRWFVELENEMRDELTQVQTELSDLQERLSQG